MLMGEERAWSESEIKKTRSTSNSLQQSRQAISLSAELRTQTGAEDEDRGLDLKGVDPSGTIPPNHGYHRSDSSASSSTTAAPYLSTLQPPVPHPLFQPSFKEPNIMRNRHCANQIRRIGECPRSDRQHHRRRIDVHVRSGAEAPRRRKSGR